MKTKDRCNGPRARTIQRLEFIRRNLDKPDEEIADMLGICRTAVHQLRQKYKITKVHGTIQRTQRTLKKMQRLKPGISAEGAAAQLGITLERTRFYGKMAGYQFRNRPAARHLYWRQRFKSLPPQLTINAVARELGVSPNYAGLLCYRHKYKVKVRSRRKPARVPIRRWLMRPQHERWLASLKSEKP